jgi:hypothetical protein
MRRIVAVLLTAILAIAGAVMVFDSSSGRGPLPTISAKDQLQRCTEVPDVTGCISDVTLASLRNNSFDELLAAATILEQTNAPFEASCHAAFHAIGSRAIDLLGSAAAAVAKVSYPLCKGGLAHGVVEAFADAEHNDRDWVDIVSSCASLITTEPGRGGECAHGIGHAIVISKPEIKVPDQLSRCLELTAPHRETNVDGPLSNHCAFGVMMGVYAPLDTEMRPISDPGELARICGTFNSLPELVDGCMRGSGYSLGENLRFFVDRPLEGVDAMLDACTSTPTADVTVGKRQTAESCVATVLQASNPIFKLSLDEYAQLCDDLGERRSLRTAAACLFEARTGLTGADHETLLSLRPELREAAKTWGSQYL